MNIDEQNDLIRRQVDEEMPRPVGGFEDPEDESDWREAKEERFMELVHEGVGL